MTSFQWDKRLETGHAEIDEQHRKLLEHCNRLHTAIETGRTRQITDDIVYFLRAYLESHFALEEALMSTRHLPIQAEHRAEHRLLKDRMHDLARRYGRGEEGMAEILAAFLEQYFVQHILTHDQALAQALRPPEQQA